MCKQKSGRGWPIFSEKKNTPLSFTESARERKLEANSLNNKQGTHSESNVFVEMLVLSVWVFFPLLNNSYQQRLESHVSWWFVSSECH